VPALNLTKQAATYTERDVVYHQYNNRQHVTHSNTEVKMKQPDNIST